MFANHLGVDHYPHRPHNNVQAGSEYNARLLLGIFFGVPSMFYSLEV
jgi:hypothetical protein